MSDTSSIASNNTTEYTEEEDLPLFKITKVKNTFINKIYASNETITKSLYHNNLVIFATDTGSLYITNPSKNLILKEFRKLHKDYITSIHVRNDFLISCCIEGIVNIISLKENKITKRYNFNRSLNYVKLHDFYDDVKNKCFFISSFNGLLVSCNLDTIENIQPQNNWLSYINFGTNLSGNTDDLKIIELLSIDSILFVEILDKNKMLIVDFNEIFIIEFHKDGTIEVLFKKNFNIKNESINIVYQNSDLLVISIDNHQKILVLDLQTYDIIKTVELNTENVICINSFNTLSYSWNKNLMIPPLLIIFSNMNISIIDINNDVVTIEDDIELPVSKNNKFINGLHTAENTLSILLKNEIFNVYPFTKKMVFDWYVENEDMIDSWMISKDMPEVADIKRYEIGLNILKDDDDKVIMVLDKNNYQKLNENGDMFIRMISEIEDKKFESISTKLIEVDTEKHDIKYLLNSGTLFILLSKLLKLNHSLFYEFLRSFENHINLDTLITLNGLIKNEEEDIHLLKTQLALSNRVMFSSNEILKIYYNILNYNIDIDHYKNEMLKYLKINSNLIKEVYNSHELLSKLETGCTSYREKTVYFTKLINIIINNVDNEVILQYLLKNNDFEYFDIMLLTRLLLVLKNDLFDLSIFEKSIDYYMFDKLYIFENNKEVSNTLILFLNKYFNDKYLLSNENKKNAFSYFLNKWSNVEDKDMFLEEVIFLYIQMNEYNELLTLILDKKDIKECISLIMINHKNVNNVLLWERIFNFVHTKDTDKIILDYLFIMEFVNKNNSKLHIDVLIFLYEKLLTKVDNFDAKINQSIKFKRLEVQKIKSLLKNELSNVYVKKMTYLQIAEYHE